MIIFSKRACLAGAVVILAFGSHAYATEAHYACSGGTKVTAQFSPPGTAMGRVALTFENGHHRWLRVKSPNRKPIPT